MISGYRYGLEVLERQPVNSEISNLHGLATKSGAAASAAAAAAATAAAAPGTDIGGSDRGKWTAGFRRQGGAETVASAN